MAYTQVTDVIIPELFVPYTIEETKERSAFWRSGVVIDDAVIQGKMANGGKELHLPFWHDLDGDDSVTSDNDTSTITPDKIDAAEQVAVVLRRAKSFSSADLAAALAGDDPMRVVAQRIAPYWSRRFQTALLNTLNGVFAETNMASEAVYDVSSDAASVPSGAYIDGPQVIKAKGTMGDAMDDIRVMAVHSVVYQRLLENDLIEFLRDSQGRATIPTYMGMNLVVSDALPTGTTSTNNNTTYTSYLFGPGAVGYGEIAPRTPVEVDRDALAGDGEGIEYFVNRRHFCLHPYGMKWAGTPAGQSPTNGELSTGGNWVRVFERKNIPLAALITNG